jgi:hypothetical protein
MIDLLNDAEMTKQYPYQFEVIGHFAGREAMHDRIGVAPGQQILAVPQNRKHCRLEAPRVLNYHPQGVGGVMKCFICGEQMRVVMVEPHVVDMQGFELRTFQCVGCGDTEKRPVFDSSRSPRETLAKTVPAPETSAPVPSSKVKAILGSLVRLRGNTPNP